MKQTNVQTLSKADIRRVFDKMNKTYPHIYGAFMEMPIEIGYITKLNDSDGKYYSFGGFFEAYGSFSDDDQFFVSLKGTFACDASDRILYLIDMMGIEVTGRVTRTYTNSLTLTAETLVQDFEIALVTWCREAILANRPLELGHKFVSKYSLNSVDTEKLIALIDHSDNIVRAELQIQYDALKAVQILNH